LTTTPSNIRNPVSVLVLSRLFPVRSNANKEPIAANGIENKSTNGVEKDSNIEAIIIKINKKAARNKN